MAHTDNATTEPTEATAGTTWQWSRTFGDHTPAGGWALAYYFRGAGTLDALQSGGSPPVVASSDNQGWVITIPAATTAGLAAGRYQWVARVTKGSDAYDVASGGLLVRPNVATAAAGALQTHAEKMLALVEAELAARVPGTGKAHESFGHADRTLELVPLKDLYAMRNRYAAEVVRERNGGNLPPFEVTFGRPR